MKTALVAILVVLVSAAIAIPAPADTSANEPPTFYFTRLVYTQLGGRTMEPPDFQYVCPEFGGGNFFPIQGRGWATDYPGGDCKFMGGVHRLTGIRVHPHPNVKQIMEELHVELVVFHDQNCFRGRIHRVCLHQCFVCFWPRAVWSNPWRASQRLTRTIANGRRFPLADASFRLDVLTSD